MDNFTMTDVAATRLGAACPVARSPWPIIVAARADYALGLAFLGVQAQFAQRSRALEPTHAAVVAAEALPMSGNLTRKPTNVNTTRINARGYGVMGPHPEREQLA